jgi:AraC family transcriptional regulator
MVKRVPDGLAKVGAHLARPAGMYGQRYQARVLRIVNHIQRHLDEPLELADLAALAGVSPYHFHRLFKGIVGEGVAEHVRRLRLERAAQELCHSARPVTAIAFDAGFGSLEGFGRAFRTVFQRTPSAYRRHGDRYQPPARSGIHYDPYREIGRIAGWGHGSRLEVRIVELAPLEVAYVRRTGPYRDSAPAAFAALWRWVDRHGGGARITRVLGFGHQDPDGTPAGQLVYDACCALEGGFETTAEVGRQVIPGGRYAVHRYQGPYAGIRDAFVQLCGEWLPASGEELDARPCFEIYLNDVAVVPAAELLTELTLPLKPPARPATGETIMDIRIETLEPVTVAYVRRRGPYQRSAPAAWSTLWRWVDEHDLGAGVRQVIGFGHHNPEVTPPEDLVYDACLEVAGGFASDAVVGRQTLPGGRYALLQVKGAYCGIGPGFDRLREWLPTQDEPFDWRPWIEIYRNSPKDTAEAELLTDLGMPLAGRVETV